jgi:pimeloyl-ACP methyl ester carboxylesterase
MQHATVTANGLETRYLRCGAGPTVVLLGGDADLAESLGQGFRVLAMEARDEADWLRGVFDGLGIGDAVLLATPRFAERAQLFAAEEPERVRGVVLLPAANRRESDCARLSEAIARYFG